MAGAYRLSIGPRGETSGSVLPDRLKHHHARVAVAVGAPVHHAVRDQPLDDRQRCAGDLIGGRDGAAVGEHAEVRKRRLLDAIE